MSWFSQAIKMRTSAKPEGKGSDNTHGLTLFLVDLRQVRAEQPDTLKVVKVRPMFNYATNQIFYQGMRVLASAVIGEGGKGFRYVIDGSNAERIPLRSLVLMSDLEVPAAFDDGAEPASGGGSGGGAGQGGDECGGGRGGRDCAHGDGSSWDGWPALRR
jgi:hypothetical protein